MEEEKTEEKKFDIILADPPWKYNFQKSSNRRSENHFPTMTLEDIKALGDKIPSKKNSVLYLWATAPKLPQALEVMKAWGYKYKTNASWDKMIMGMGYWFRGQHEHLLVGVKGKFSPPPTNARFRSTMIEKRAFRVAKKPEISYEYIEKAFPDELKLELFARYPREGWDVWGNEVESTVKL